MQSANRVTSVCLDKPVPMVYVWSHGWWRTKEKIQDWETEGAADNDVKDPGVFGVRFKCKKLISCRGHGEKTKISGCYWLDRRYQECLRMNKYLVV